MARSKNRDEDVVGDDPATTVDDEPGDGPAAGEETTTENAPQEPAAEQAPPNVDVVSMVSLRKDGTPDQTEPFEFLDEENGAAVLADQQASVSDPNVDLVIANRDERRRPR